MPVAGLILAGGLGTRLGGVDKPLLRLGATTLIEHLLARLRPQLGAVAISANGDPARYRRFGLPVLPDQAPGLGPLGGIAAGLAWADGQGAEWLLSVPGDTPFVPPDLLARLSPPPAVAASAGRVHHAVAVWPVAARAALEQRLASGGERSISGFARTVGMRIVTFEAGPRDPFFNVNTPQDLAEARGAG